MEKGEKKKKKTRRWDAERQMSRLCLFLVPLEKI